MLCHLPLLAGKRMKGQGTTTRPPGRRLGRCQLVCCLTVTVVAVPDLEGSVTTQNSGVCGGDQREITLPLELSACSFRCWVCRQAFPNQPHSCQSIASKTWLLGTKCQTCGVTMTVPTSRTGPASQSTDQACNSRSSRFAIRHDVARITFANCCVSIFTCCDLWLLKRPDMGQRWWSPANNVRFASG